MNSFATALARAAGVFSALGVWVTAALTPLTEFHKAVRLADAREHRRQKHKQKTASVHFLKR